METLIFEVADKEKAKALKQVAKALGIPLARSSENAIPKNKEEKSYSAAFVAELQQAEQDIADGKGIPVTLDDIWKS